ncbi:hypothetical protein [Bacillus thuringiensis]|uniref:hypothetical protein n=1 Tax=Bacillus thuringiensis TaxID=1428 RepID=UPI0011A8C690|nr:hypothetical protein [Bacillus thuringiensis]
MNQKISIEEFTEELQEKYTLSIEETHQMLLQHEITKSKDTQVTMRLLRDNVIDALLIGKGKVEDRKWLVNKQSLLNYVAFKTMNFADFVEMQQQVEQYQLLKEKLQDVKLLI